LWGIGGTVGETAHFYPDPCVSPWRSSSEHKDSWSRIGGLGGGEEGFTFSGWESGFSHDCIGESHAITFDTWEVESAGSSGTASPTLWWDPPRCDQDPIPLNLDSPVMKPKIKHTPSNSDKNELGGKTFAEACSVHEECVKGCVKGLTIFAMLNNGIVLENVAEFWPSDNQNVKISPGKGMKNALAFSLATQSGGTACGNLFCNGRVRLASLPAQDDPEYELDQVLQGLQEAGRRAAMEGLACYSGALDGLEYSSDGFYYGLIKAVYELGQDVDYDKCKDILDTIDTVTNVELPAKNYLCLCATLRTDGDSKVVVNVSKNGKLTVECSKRATPRDAMFALQRVVMPLAQFKCQLQVRQPSGGVKRGCGGGLGARKRRRDEA